MACADAPPSPRSSKRSSGGSCEECTTEQWKYRCPGCSILTCSLPCVQSHKRRTGCTGKRSREEVVPLSKFDDDLLISDYNFLEEAKRVAESANRMLSQFGQKPPFYKLHPELRSLMKAAGRRKTKVLFLSPGMSKREKNQSRFDTRNQTIFWTIEWRFHSTDVIIMDHLVGERSTWSSAIKKHLNPCPWNNPLRPFCDVQLEDLKLIIKKNAMGAKSPFRELNIHAPINHQLSKLLLVEYPVVHVFLPSHSFDFDIHKDTRWVSNSKPAENCNFPVVAPAPREIMFREEEIEEGELSPDASVIDLKDQTCYRTFDADLSTESFREASKSGNISCSKSDNLSSRHLLVSPHCEIPEPFPVGKCRANMAESNKDPRTTPEILENLDFEQDLKDAFSDLTEVNPDDFLCLDGWYADEEDSLFGEGLFPSMEELEEGEIVD